MPYIAAVRPALPAIAPQQDMPRAWQVKGRASGDTAENHLVVHHAAAAHVSAGRLARVRRGLGRVPGVREGIWWHAAYLSNVCFFLDNGAGPGDWGHNVSHFWSLAVEEQFYLMWPCVILFAPRRCLPGIALGLAAVGPVSRYVVFTTTGNDITPVLLPGCIDSLALGAYPGHDCFLIIDRLSKSFVRRRGVKGVHKPARILDAASTTPPGTKCVAYQRI
jgi:hypothetical protein